MNSSRVVSLFPPARKSPEKIVSGVAYDEIVESRLHGRHVAEVLSHVGIEGLRRIQQGARDDLWRCKIRTAFQSAYVGFRRSYKLPPKDTPGRPTDKLEAFAIVAGKSRATMDRYLNGHCCLTVQDLHEVLQRCNGPSVSTLLPTTDEVEYAICNATMLAMRKARGIRSGSSLSMADFALLQDIANKHPIPLGGFKNDRDWYEWLCAFLQSAHICVSTTSDDQAELNAMQRAFYTLVTSGDWQVVRRLLLMQITVAVATVLRLLERDALGESNRLKRQRSIDTERRVWRKAVSDLGKELNRRINEKCACPSRVPDCRVELAAALTHAGAYWDALIQLSSLAREIPEYLATRSQLAQGWQALLARLFNTIVMAHGEMRVDVDRPPETVEKWECQFAHAEVTWLLSYLSDAVPKMER